MRTMCAPSAASASAVARPIPLPAPVMTATRPSSRFVMTCLLVRLFWLSMQRVGSAKVIQRTNHILNNFLTVGFTRAFFRNLVAAMHDDNTICYGKHIRQCVANQDDRNVLFAQLLDEVEDFA